MPSGNVKKCDATPLEIRIALLRNHVTQTGIAQYCNVSKTAVSRTIYGKSASHRIREAIAFKTGIEIDKLWPSIYLYGSGPRKKGRPKLK